MIKCIIGIIVLQIFTFHSSNLKSQDFQWVKQGKGSEANREVKIANGISRDVYLARNYNDNAAFANVSFKSKGGIDFSIAKYDSKGTVDWAISCGGIGNDEVNDIVCDKDGNVLVTGYFSETIFLDQIQLTSSGNQDIFIAKFDKRGGKCQWAITSGGKGVDVANSIGLDVDGNIIITGVFSNSAQFNGSVLDANGSSDIFIAKYTTERQLVWLKSINSLDDRSESTALVINNNNDVILAGNFYNNLLVENTPILIDSNLAKVNLPNSFLISLDKSGKLRWMNSIVSMLNDSYVGVSKGLTYDDNGNIYLSGGVSGLASAFPHQLISESPGNQDLFFACCSPLGNWSWVKTSGGDDLRYGIDMTTALAYKKDLIYAVGYFDGTLKLDNVLLRSNGGLYDSDIFIIALNVKGEFIWGKFAGASSNKVFEFNDIATDIVVNERGEIFIAGRFNGEAKFETVQVKSNNTKEVFLAKMGSAQSLARSSKVDADSITTIIYPNPVVSENLNLKIEGTGERTLITMYDEIGNLVKVVFDGKLKRNEYYNFIVKENELHPGTYQIKVITKNETAVKKVVVIK